MSRRRASASSGASGQSTNASPSADGASRMHFRVGWWSLLVFLTLGLVLEGLSGFKAGLYLDVSNSTRRLMWTLAHAHGTLLSVLNLIFAIAVRLVDWNEARLSLASRCLLGALALMPLGFFLGGVTIHAGDPGLGVLLVPPGGLLLFVGVLLTASAFGRREDRDG